MATASIFLAAGVAGVFFVLTLEALRRRGLGGAITVACLDDARHAGYRVGVLGASPLGHPVYSRIGFRDVGKIDIDDFRLEA